MPRHPTPDDGDRCRHKLPPALAVAAWAGVALVLLGVGWTLSTPLNGVADEQAHYDKALGTGGGELLGAPAPPAPVGATSNERFLASTSRTFTVPGYLDTKPGGYCFILRPEVPASCAGPIVADGATTVVTYVGAYPPLSYVLGGLVARRMSTPAAAWTAARLANGVTCTALWVAAAAVYLSGRRHRRLLLFGLLAGVTPAAMQLGWCYNPNGIEAAAGLATCAAALAATRPDGGRSAWWVLGAAGFVLGASRPVSFVWVAFILLVPVALRGPGAVLAALRRRRRAAVTAVTAACVGAGSTVVWDLVEAVHSPSAQRDWVTIVSLTWHQWLSLQDGAATQLDWGELGLAGHLHTPWLLMVAALIAFALLVGGWRERLGLLLVTIGYFGVSVGLVGLSYGSGFPTGGRYLLATGVALPLAAAEVAAGRSRRYEVVGVAAGAGLVVLAGTQVWALYESGRRYAVGVSGPATYFLGTGRGWVPPGGWVVCDVAVVVGAATMAALGCADRLGGAGPPVRGDPAGISGR
jgi:hypothetical protein